MGKLSSVVKAIEGAKRARLEAYHGTPHEVDKFSSQHIGTGEGAQAYGHGLYFAEHPDTAKQYQRQLATRDLQDEKWISNDGSEIKGDDVSWEIGDELSFEFVNDNLSPHRGTGYADNAMDYMRQGLSKEEALNSTDDLKVKKAIEILYRDYGKHIPKEQGNLYKVELDIDPDTEMLDWDKPLSDELAEVYKQHIKSNLSEMNLRRLESDPEMVAKMPHLQKAKKQLDEASNTQGSTLYNILINDLGDASAVSNYLHSKGIKGIKYSDQMSRGAEGGTSNFVIFDDNLIRIAEKNGVPFEQVEKLATERGISKQQALSMLVGGTTGAALMGNTQEAEAGTLDTVTDSMGMKPLNEVINQTRESFANRRPRTDEEFKAMQVRSAANAQDKLNKAASYLKSRAKQGSQAAKEALIGMQEVALTVGSGMANDSLAGLLGVVASADPRLQGAGMVEQVQSDAPLQYTPKSEKGVQYLESLSGLIDLATQKTSEAGSATQGFIERNLPEQVGTFTRGMNPIDNFNQSADYLGEEVHPALGTGLKLLPEALF